MMRKALILLLPIAVAVAGCGSATTATAPVASKHAVVKTRHGRLGTFLVDGSGRTLYRFLKDTGRKSHCTGQCASFWPPLTTSEKPEAEGGAKASMLGTSRRANGAKQVTYGGRPLYHYAPDTKPGQTTGQGINAFGARWYVESPSGKVIKASATPSPYRY
jgi:predicted lipoprotein with Yx(FWY)xxD motif